MKQKELEAELHELADIYLLHPNVRKNHSASVRFGIRRGRLGRPTVRTIFSKPGEPEHREYFYGVDRETVESAWDALGARTIDGGIVVRAALQIPACDDHAGIWKYTVAKTTRRGKDDGPSRACLRHGRAMRVGGALTVLDQYTETHPNRYASAFSQSGAAIDWSQARVWSSTHAEQIGSLVVIDVQLHDGLVMLCGHWIQEMADGRHLRTPALVFVSQAPDGTWVTSGDLDAYAAIEGDMAALDFL
jgi:hypothetical protein